MVEPLSYLWVSKVRNIAHRKKAITPSDSSCSGHFFIHFLRILTSSGFFDLLHLWIRRNILRLAEV